MKKLLIVVALLSVSNSCFAYNDYGYSYGIATPYSGGFDSSMRVREMENDSYRQNTLNAMHPYTPPVEQPRVQESSSQSTYTSPGYGGDKPLYVFGR